MTDKSKKILRLIITIVLIVASVYYAIKDINMLELWNIIVSANYFWVLLPVPVILLSHWVRAMRWKTMLEPALKKKSASTWNLFSAVMIGYAVNCVSPRGGELIRPYVYARREKVSFSTSFATIIVERFVDLIALLLIFAIVFIFFSDEIIKILPKLSGQKLFTVVVILFFVSILSFYPPVFRFLIKFLIKPISTKFYEKISGIFERFLKGFAVIKSPSRYTRMTIETIAIWLFYTIPLYVTFFAFDFQYEKLLGFEDAVFLIVVSGIAVTIAPVPGAIGVYHVLIQNALVRLYGVDPAEALAYATVTHTINYLIQISIGGIFFLRENIKKLPKKAEDISYELGNDSETNFNSIIKK